MSRRLRTARPDRFLRRCDGPDCGRRFLPKANHHRAHAFCCEAHRRAYDHAHRQPAEQAAYMRRYRAAKRAGHTPGRFGDGLTVRQHAVLDAVLGHWRTGSRPTATYLAEVVGVSRQAIAKHIRTLVGLGRLGSHAVGRPGTGHGGQVTTEAGAGDLPDWMFLHGLTSREAAVLRVAFSHFRRTGSAPTIATIARRMYRAQTTVATQIRTLRDKGIDVLAVSGPTHRHLPGERAMSVRTKGGKNS